MYNLYSSCACGWFKYLHKKIDEASLNVKQHELRSKTTTLGVTCEDRVGLGVQDAAFIGASKLYQGSRVFLGNNGRSYSRTLLPAVSGCICRL